MLYLEVSSRFYSYVTMVLLGFQFRSSVAYLWSPKKYLFLGLLGQIAILDFPNPPSTLIVLIGLGLI